jgi:nitrogen regulatory protein PII
MKMLMVVFRDSLQDEILALLKGCDVKAYTLVQNVAGAGEAGTALGSFASPGVNSMVLVVLPEDQANRSVEALKVYRDGLAEDHPTHKAPIRAFALPCTQVV